MTDGWPLAEGGEGDQGGAFGLIALIVLIFVVAACCLVAAFLRKEQTPRWLAAAALLAVAGFASLNAYRGVAWSESELRAAVEEATEAVDGSSSVVSVNPLDDALKSAADDRGSLTWLHVENKGWAREISAEGTSARFCVSVDASTYTETVDPGRFYGRDDSEPYETTRTRYRAAWYEGACKGNEK